jgi:hypothetical protein
MFGLGPCEVFAALLFLAGIYAAILFITRDARGRGVENWMLWAFLVLITFPWGLIVYLAVRPPKPAGRAAACPSCGGRISASSNFCAACGRADPALCLECGNKSQPPARYCPKCGHDRDLDG